MSNKNRRALGRGLGALLPGSNAKSTAGNTDRSYFLAPIEEIFPNPEQPRKRFDETELADLAASIEEHGVIQPVIVRRRPAGGFFLIAGERRWRASQRAGLHKVPVVVQAVSPRDAFERAIVENVQRADLNIIEEAEAFSRLMSEYDYTQEQVATRVGKDRSTVANSLRLLKLAPKVRAMVEEEILAMGHARALLAIEEPSAQERLARMIVAKKLSVRAAEKLVRAEVHDKPESKTKSTAKSASVRDVEDRLTKALGAPVGLSEDKRGRGGTIEIRYSDLDELDRLLEHLIRS